MGKPEYLSLHTHSSYSLGDSSAKIDDIVARVKSLGQRACALTDHGTMAGVVEFYKECKKAEIKPLIGCEMYVAWKSAREPKSHENPTGHMILIARNLEGYQNLCRLLEWSHRFGFSYKNRIDLEILEQHSKGLIGLSACVGGLPQRAILGWSTRDRTTKKRVHQVQQLDLLAPLVGRLRDLFDRDCFLLEIQNHKMRDPSALTPAQWKDYQWLLAAQREVARVQIDIGKRMGVPLVGTGDCHYVTRENMDTRQVVLAMHDKQILPGGFTGEMADPRAHSEDAEESVREFTGEMYLKSAGEMYEALHGEHFPELLSNTLAIADMVDLKLEPPKDAQGKNRFDLPAIDLLPGERPIDKLRRLAEAGYRVRYPDDPPEARARLEHELSVMDELGFAEYHLVVEEFVRWAKDNDVPVGPGRGSGGGSIVVYCLGITDLDPLRWSLLFVRYINKARVSVPDLDIDFDPLGVDRVIAHCTEKYGKDHVAHIAAYGSLHAKGSVRKVGKVFALHPSWVAEISDGLPDDQGEFRSPMKALLEEENTQSARILNSFRKAGGETAERMLDLCVRLDDVKTHRSEHAAGIVISGRPLRESVPLVAHDRDDPDRLTAELPFEYLEQLGLLKMDFLRIDGLTILSRTLQWIRERREPAFALPSEKDETYADPATLRLFAQGDLHGVWQFSSAAMRKIAVELRPSGLDEIAAIVALYRPGPLDYVDPALHLNMVEIFVRRKQGKLPIQYEHPSLEPILKSTFGVCVAAGSLVRAASGWKPIETVTTLDIVQTETGEWRPVTALICSGERDCVRVRMTNGEDLVVTPDHLIQTVRGWIPACELTKSDLVMQFWGCDEAIPLGDRKDWLVGLALADGDICSSTPNVCCSSEKFAWLVKVVADKSWGLNCTVYKNGRAWYVSLRGRRRKNPFTAYLREQGLAGLNCYTKRFPEQVSLMMAVGFFEGDGCVGNNRLRVKNELLARRFWEILQARRIDSSIYLDDKDVWNVAVYSALPLVLKKHRTGGLMGGYVPRPDLSFIPRSDYLRQHSYRKTYLGKSLLRHIGQKYSVDLIPDRPYGKVLSVKPSGNRSVYDLSVAEHHSFVVGGSVVHNCVYQEQVMQLTNVLCGWSDSQADELRKAIGKKLKDAIAKQGTLFVPAAVAHSGLTEEHAQRIWAQIVTFGEYAFNRSHSAAYGKLAYQMAYLKAHYPVEFLAACLANAATKGDKEKREGQIHGFVDACNRHGIPVLGPLLGRSSVGTQPEGQSIRLGFEVIRGISSAAIKIVAADVLETDPVGIAIQKLGSAGVGPANMRHLAHAGCFDAYGNRNQVLAVIEQYATAKKSKKKMEAFFGLAPVLQLPDLPPPSPAELERMTLDRLALLPARAVAPPPKKIMVRVSAPSELEKLRGLPKGPTEVSAWLRLPTTQAWALIRLGSFQMDRSALAGLEVLSA